MNRKQQRDEETQDSIALQSVKARESDSGIESTRVEKVRQRAYEIYLEQGSVHGSDLHHWLQAEREEQEKQ